MKKVNQLALSSLAALTMLGGFGAATVSAKTTSYSHYVVWNKPTVKKYAVHYKNNKSVLLNHPYKTANNVKKVHNMNNYKHTTFYTYRHMKVRGGTIYYYVKATINAKSIAGWVNKKAIRFGKANPNKLAATTPSQATTTTPTPTTSSSSTQTSASSSDTGSTAPAASSSSIATTSDTSNSSGSASTPTTPTTPTDPTAVAKAQAEKDFASGKDYNANYSNDGAIQVAYAQAYYDAKGKVVDAATQQAETDYQNGKSYNPNYSNNSVGQTVYAQTYYNAKGTDLDNAFTTDRAQTQATKDFAAGKPYNPDYSTNTVAQVAYAKAYYDAKGKVIDAQQSSGKATATTPTKKPASASSSTPATKAPTTK